MTYGFAAAGTGGHVYPALSVADVLRAQGVSRDDIVFFGGDRMEATVVPAAGYDFTEVEIRGLRRSLSTANLRLPGMIRRATAAIARELRERSVRSVAVFGGYVSVPAALAARRAGAAIVVHEQNAHPGLANRLIAPRARATLVAFPAALGRLRSGRVVGNPLRPALAAFDRNALRDAARARYGLPGGLPVLGVLGGSLGAKVLNDAVVRIAAEAEAGSFAIVHLAGSQHYEELAPLSEQSPVSWTVRAFEESMEYFYAAIDVALCRAGALTISELAVTATPSVLVPLEETHQEDNARVLVAEGGAVMVRQADIGRVPAMVRELLADDGRRASMGRAALRLAHPDAAEVVARVLQEAAGHG